MFQSNRTTRASSEIVALVLCATLVTNVAISAPPTLQSIAVTPVASSISVGQKQYFTAKGTFSNGSTHLLGPDVANIAAGQAGTCVLLTSSAVKCWGNNEYGQLGDGTTTDSLVPRPVKWITRATAVGYGGYHGCALLANGAVECWGFNAMGQLGNGSASRFSSLPVPVTGISSATAVGAGAVHSCALLVSGEVHCWGQNTEGELGDGTNAHSRIPVRVTGISSATAVSTGAMHSCALLASGAVQCWGNNYVGGLGDGTTTNSNKPVTVVGINNATAIAAGGHFTCALLADATVKCWGNNLQGELGDGGSWPYTEYSSNPVSVVGISTAVAITAGGYHACAVLTSGSAWCWGDNEYGQLGNGLTTALASSTPVRVLQIAGPVRLAAGLAYTCALLSDGAMRCWGWNGAGELGNRRRVSAPTRWPVNVIGTPGVTWLSSDPTKATFTYGQMATGRAVGNTTISATTAGFINDNAVLTVK